MVIFREKKNPRLASLEREGQSGGGLALLVQEKMESIAPSHDTRT